MRRTVRQNHRLSLHS